MFLNYPIFLKKQEQSKNKARTKQEQFSNIKKEILFFDSEKKKENIIDNLNFFCYTNYVEVNNDENRNIEKFSGSIIWKR